MAYVIRQVGTDRYIHYAPTIDKYISVKGVMGACVFHQIGAELICTKINIAHPEDSWVVEAIQISTGTTIRPIEQVLLDAYP